MTNHSEALKSTYNRQAHVFDRGRAKNLFEKQWLDQFCNALPRSAKVLDVGCGSGEPISRYLKEQGFMVSGVDQSAVMLEIAESRMPEMNWHLMDMRDLDLNETFDGIIAFNSLFHLTPNEQRKALPKILGHGSAECEFFTTTGIEEGEAWGKVGGEDVYHGSLSQEEYRSILEEAGFSVLDHRTDPDCNDHTLLLAQRKKQKANQ